MKKNSEIHPGSRLKKKYSKLSLTAICFDPQESVLLSSIIKVENVDVSVEKFEDVLDADNNDFFKVEFE